MVECEFSICFFIFFLLFLNCNYNYKHFIISLRNLCFGKFAFKIPNLCFSVNLCKESRCEVSLFKKRKRGGEREGETGSVLLEKVFFFCFGKDHEEITKNTYKDILSTCTLCFLIAGKLFNGKEDNF